MTSTSRAKNLWSVQPAPRRFAAILLAGTALTVMPTAAQAQTTWTGTTSTDWFANGNWSTNAQPTLLTDVVVDTATPNPTVINVFNASAKSLIVGQAHAAQVTVMGGGHLTVAGDTNLGTTNAGSGTILVTGAGSQFSITNGGNLNIGIAGNGTFGVLGGATATVHFAEIGQYGSLGISGYGTSFSSEEGVVVGQNGGGALQVDNQAVATSFGLDVGQGGVATVDGLDTKLTLTSQTAVASETYVGHDGSGTLNVSNSAAVSADLLSIGTGAPNAPLGGNGTMAISTGATITSSSGDIGEYAEHVGKVTVDGTGSSWTDSSALNIGTQGGAGTLAITNGGVVTAGQSVFGIGTGSSGVVTVDGAHSALNLTDTLSIGGQGATGSLTLTSGGTGHATEVGLGTSASGKGTLIASGTGAAFNTDILEVGVAGTGTLSVQTGAALTINNLSIATLTGSTGNATVTGPGASLAASQAITIDSGTGSFSVLGGAHASDDVGIVGQFAGVNATATVAGVGSQWTSQAYLSIAAEGTGTLTIVNGGAVKNVNSVVGQAAASSGMVSVSGVGSQWATTGDMVIGDQGTGTLSLAGNATTSSYDTSVAQSAGGRGTVTIDGAGSVMTTTHEFDDGGFGLATLRITNGGELDDAAGTVAIGGGSTALAVVSGAGSKWANSSNLIIGGGYSAVGSANGTLSIDTGGVVTNTSASLGSLVGSTGTVTIDGPNSRWLSSDDVTIGYDGTGFLTLQNGALATAKDAYIAFQGTGTVSVSDPQTHWQITGDIIVGGNSTAAAGTGFLSILNGGLVTSTTGDVGGLFATDTGSLHINGTGSGWTNSGQFLVGGVGTGNMTVTSGGLISDNAGGLGLLAGSSGTGTIDGAGSLWYSPNLQIGIDGTGKLTLSNGGAVSASVSVGIANDTGSTGTLIIGADPVNAPAAPGALNTPLVVFGDGTGTIDFNHNSGNYVFAPQMQGVGTINQIAGVTVLTGNASQFGGTVNVQGGTLLVNDVLGTGTGSVFVQSGGSLGGTGTIHAPVSIAGGGTLLGVQGQTLGADSLVLGSAANVDVSLGSPGGAALFAVTHDLTLDGTLNITSLAGFGPGVFRIMNYGGTLTDHGLDIGTVPGGTSATAFSVQTSVAGQVNLVEAIGPSLSFWDGDAAGSAGNGAVDGGSGTWSVTSTNWTDMNGASNGAMAPQPGFAVFEGAPGTVTVDGSAGAVTVSGMQFAVDGYRVQGDPITLSDPQSIFRVGDGTSAGAGYTATIASRLTGSGGLTKTDLGTLILTGQNDYAGNTNVDAGTLEIGLGGIVTGAGGSIAGLAGSTANATLLGGSAWTSTGELDVGYAGNGTLALSAGAGVAVKDMDIGSQAGATGLVAVNASSLAATDAILVGGDLATLTGSGTGTLVVSNGGVVNTPVIELGRTVGSTGTVTVQDAGSALNATVVVVGVGTNSSTTLNVRGGAAVIDTTAILGATGGTAVGTVDGAGSTWTNSGVLALGYQSAGTLTLSNGGTVSAAGGISIANMAGSTGILNIGAAAGDPAAGAGVLQAATLTFGAGSGTVAFNHTSSNYVFSTAMSGAGLLNQYAGVTRLTGDSSGFTGASNVLGGTLLVDGALGAGPVTVLSGATLGGSGTIGGQVTVVDGGHLLGVEGQTLTLAALTLGNSANVDVTLGAPGGAGLFHVGGDVTLDGVLNITSTAGFGPGVYRLFDYGGTLTDNGLDIGATPSGIAATNLTIQTSVANQVNVVDVMPTSLTFWDGDAAGNAGNDKVDGGTGTWSAVSANFTDVNGATNGAMVPQPGFAIFQGAAGIVTVDASAGPIAVTGMQFASDGYHVIGDPITLANPDSIVRVGDGTTAGAGYSATIGSVLTGTGGLDKTDLGTLILTGTNSYTGGTTITSGTLQIGDGSVGGFASVKGAIVDNAALVFDNQSTLETSNDISGSGSVHFDGPTLFTGTGTYTGGTAIGVDGELTLGGNGITGSIIGDVSNNGILRFNRSDDVGFDGVVSGTGILFQTGDGKLTLTGVNTFTGRTGILYGTLALAGNGSIASSAGLSISQSGTFDISATNAGASIATLSGDGNVALGAQTLTLTNANNQFDGVISGTGGLTLANGTETLTGANAYSGGTAIAHGTLIGSATSFGTGAIDVDGALVLDQSSNASFANVIGGAGSFTKQGAGILTLTGDSTFTGATTVASGRLSVNGSLADSVVTVKSGANLGGNGTVGGVIAENGSTIAPGNSIGLLHVAGNYSQASGSTYQVELTSTGQADRLDVAGTATIANGALLSLTKTDAAPYVFGAQYKLLDAAGGISGTYTLTGNTQISAFMGLVLAYDADDVYLDVAKTKSFASAGGTPNQVATGGGLDSLPDANPLVGAIVVMPDVATAQAAFDQLSGEVHASAKAALVEDSRFVREAALGRLDTAGADKLAFWGQGIGSKSTIEGDGNTATLEHSTAGFLMGVDAPLGNVRIGALGGYSHDSIDVASRHSSGGGDNYHLGIYGGVQAGGFALRAGAAYSWNDLDFSRSVAFAGFNDTLKSRYHAHTAQAFGEVAYKVVSGSGAVEPFANLAWVNLKTDAFTEKGGAAALSARADSSSYTFSTAGVKGSVQLELGHQALTLRTALGWRHAWGDVVPTSTLAFQGGAAFAIQGTPIARDAMSVDSGIDADLGHGMRLGISYAGQFAQHAHDNGVRANLTVAF